LNEILNKNDGCQTKNVIGILSQTKNVIGILSQTKNVIGILNDDDDDDVFGVV
jgi:hypothetical protein